MIRNLGQVAAIYIGSSAPRNTNLIWLDNTVVPFVFRAYDGSAWSEIATHKWVRAYVDGWLVTLPPRQLADDGDYMLINSNNVNYKITVKDFVKSAVGNPLDFKGVIRVSADFPNPSTLESGDMYVIITSPAGGTVTDPYSGKTFEDSEKIVWDEVTQSWESLGKIDITVDLTTSYSETEVTIHSSAGKETTIQGATDQLAGVMLPGQYSWLQALSNGSIVPGDPSPLTPLTPAHKHNYNDIINRLVSQQGTGESTIDPMSQKATTDALNLKFDKVSVLQVSGAATDKVMSQKAVTDALKTLSDDFNNKLTNYLPLAGGTMKGSIRFPAESGIIGNADGTRDTYILRSFNNRLDIGSAALSTRIISNASDLLHHRSDTSYKIWDAYNLPTPASTTDLANYLPLIGGTLTGQVIFDSYGLAFNNIAWTNDLVPNRTYGGYLQVLDAYNASSDGGPTNYGTVLQVNSRNAHWANQLWFSSLGLYHRHMAYGQTEYSDWQKILTNKDVNIIPTQSASNPSSLPVNQIFYSEIHGVTGTPTTKGLLFSAQGDDEGIQLWADSTRAELYYRIKWASYGNWIKLATTSDLNSYLTKTEASTLYYPYNGRGYLSITSTGKPVMSNNQGYAVKDKDGNEREVLWMGTNNALFLGNTSQYTLGQLDLRCTTLTHNGNKIATQNYVTNQLTNYLPLTGGTLSGNLTINTVGSTTFVINNNDTNGSETFMRVLRKGTASAAIGFRDSLGAYIYNYNSNKYLFIDNDGYARVGTTSSSTRLALITDIPTVSGYLPLSGGTMSGNISFNGGTGHIVVGARETSNFVSAVSFNKGSATNSAYIGYHSTGGSDSSGALVLVPYPTSANPWAKTVGLYIAKNELLLDGKAIATTDQIPSIPSISISNSGSGNAVTSITASGHTLTVTKGATYLTSHQTIYNLTFQAGTFAAKTFDPNGAAATVNIPTNTSHLTNDSGFITSSALNGYATQAWVNSQNFVKSTSTKKVTDIQPVDALPATQASGVLYLVFG